MRLFGTTVLGLTLLATPALARREATFSYPYERVWTTAVRTMRIDFACPIPEKDKDDGYFLFEYTDREKQYSGSVELTSMKQNGVEQVRVVIQLAEMPSYVEQMMLDKLEKKLRAEYGDPREIPAPQAPKVESSATVKPAEGDDKPKPEGTKPPTNESKKPPAKQGS